MSAPVDPGGVFAQVLKVASTPKEVLRLLVVGFGALGFLQVAGRADIVGAEPVFGPWQSLGLALVCLILLEVYSHFQRKLHLDEQERVAEKVVAGE